MSRRRARRGGSVLLEAVVALAVLGTVASVAAWKAAETLRAVSHVHAREEDIRAAYRFLSAVSLWSREDLDRHLGSRPQGPWMMHVGRIGPDLYEVILEDTASKEHLLRTTLFQDLEDGL